MWSPKQRYCLESPKGVLARDCHQLIPLLCSQRTNFLISLVLPQTLEKESIKKWGVEGVWSVCGKEVSRRDACSESHCLSDKAIKWKSIGWVLRSSLSLGPTWVSEHICVLMENCYSLFPRKGN